MADCASFQATVVCRNKSMGCRRISMEGEVEEVAVSQRPKSRQKHEKRPSPYSTRGLDKFKSVWSELSSKLEYIAKKIGVPEALVRLMDSKNGCFPILMRARAGIGKKNSHEGDVRVSMVGHVEKVNDANHEDEHHPNPKTKIFRRVMSMDNGHNISPARHVQGFDSSYRSSSPAMGYDSSVGATLMIISLFCLLFCGPVYAILIWLYLLPSFTKV